MKLMDVREYSLLTDAEIKILNRLFDGKKRQSFSSNARRAAVSDTHSRTGDKNYDLDDIDYDKMMF